MKIIGLDANGAYICVVDHSELEKVFDKYYGKLPRLKAGDAVDLAKGYNFRAEITDACKSMVDASRKFSAAQKTLSDFALMVAAIPGPGEDS